MLPGTSLRTVYAEAQNIASVIPEARRRRAVPLIECVLLVSRMTVTMISCNTCIGK